MNATEVVRSEQGSLCADGSECHWCRREAPCECMTLVRDGGPFYEPITATHGWSWHPERCMCSCGGCQA